MSIQLPNTSPEYANQQWIPTAEEYLSEKVASDSNALRTALNGQGPAPWQLVNNSLSAGREFAQGQYGGVERGIPTSFITQNTDLQRNRIDESMVGAETVPGVEQGISMQQALNLGGVNTVPAVTPYPTSQQMQ